MVQFYSIYVCALTAWGMVTNTVASSKQISNGFLWKLLERFGVEIGQFILQIVLARILAPEHYGVLSMMVIFTALANVFIQRGFNTALIQNKDVTDEDYSSVFWVTLSIATVIYGLLFISAPWIAYFYDIPELTAPFRVLCLVLFPGAINSIQLAKISRKLDFKMVFRSNVIAIAASGAIGIVLAMYGAGLWALVAQNILNVLIACIVMWFTVKWRPRFVCNLSRVKVLFAYGWKLLVSGLLDTLYQDIRSLVIGKKYDAATLGVYNRGKQFPQFIINSINWAVQSVMLPALSSEQDDKKKVKELMRRSIMLSSYVIFPIMAGLAGVATPLVRLLLTEKWLPCVPYMQIYCFTLAFYPVHSCNLQAINAVGRSDVFLKLELIKKGYGLLALIIATVFFRTPIAIAMTGTITCLVSCFVNASPNRKLIGYSYFEQMKDIIPAFLSSLTMLGCVLLVQLLGLGSIATLVLQVVVGVVVYVTISAVFGLSSYKLMLSIVKGFFKKKST